MGSICRPPSKELDCFKTILAHDDKIVCIIELLNKKIVTGSYDKTIKIWNLDNFICEKTIIEKYPILCVLEMEQNMLLSGTEGNSIQLWNLNSSSNYYIFSFQGHGLWINCLVKLNESIFASGSNDSNIKSQYSGLIPSVNVLSPLFEV